MLSPVSPSVAEGGRSLDQRTELPRWHVSAYPDVGEATICWSSPGNCETAASVLTEEERRRLNHQRATRRAISESRRYMVGNRLRYMWVLTFREGRQGAEGRQECMRLVARFAEDLSKEFGRQAYWYSPELHPGGHGWHVNFFVGQWMSHDVVSRLWGHGFTHVSDWAAPGRWHGETLTFVQALRRAAQYGCKYASKDWAEDVLEGGAHRYEIAQGFKPRKVSIRSDSLGGAFRFASHFFDGRPPDETWRSDDQEGWDGPPVYCLTWSDIAGDRDGG